MKSSVIKVLEMRSFEEETSVKHESNSIETMI